MQRACRNRKIRLLYAKGGTVKNLMLMNAGQGKKLIKYTDIKTVCLVLRETAMRYLSS
ncbi:hypothetical protein IMSAG249_02392 [Lachnospiraceae bacterium]|jgi:hypothetical protein|nr:hypothetical protein IMSAGC009_01022 [Lachnospiraceae bacterium]GFI70563.1 hypothetical protein IMSAG249_02392 [Lachnospiraceae bacterium]